MLVGTGRGPQVGVPKFTAAFSPPQCHRKPFNLSTSTGSASRKPGQRSTFVLQLPARPVGAEKSSDGRSLPEDPWRPALGWPAGPPVLGRGEQGTGRTHTGVADRPLGVGPGAWKLGARAASESPSPLGVMVLNNREGFVQVLPCFPCFTSAHNSIP